MNDDQLVAVRELRDCYVRLGLWSKAPLFRLQYESGKVAIAYPIYAYRGGSPVYVTVAEL
jgi:hypothetical protein